MFAKTRWVTFMQIKVCDDRCLRAFSFLYFRLLALTHNIELFTALKFFFYELTRSQDRHVSLRLHTSFPTPVHLGSFGFGFSLFLGSDALFSSLC